MRKLLVFVLSLGFAFTALSADKMTFSKIGGGSAIVTTTKTAVRLSTGQGCGLVLLTAVRAVSHDASGVTVGGSNVNAGFGVGGTFTPSSKIGITIPSNDTVILQVSDVSMLYVDALTGDGVSYIYLQ